MINIIIGGLGGVPSHYKWRAQKFLIEWDMMKNKHEETFSIPNQTLRITESKRPNFYLIYP